MGVIKGTDLMLFVKGSGDEYNTIAFATSCQLTVNAASLETSSKDSGKWTSKQASKLSWSMTSDNLFTVEEFSKIFNKLVERTPIEVVFTLCTNADSDTGMPSEGWTPDTENGYKGTAIITALSANAADNENATFNVSLEGCSALGNVGEDSGGGGVVDPTA